MKILTLTGTRPELIRLAVILKKLHSLSVNCVVEHVHVYTNQNYDPNLSSIFLQELDIHVDYMFDKTTSIGEFLSKGFLRFEEILNTENPDKILVLGDTNSVLFAILAAKRGIPVYHMEAGNRCYDTAVPEETNRKIIDACSFINLPYNYNSKENLIREGHSKNNVYKIGNPIGEVLEYYADKIGSSIKLKQLGVLPYTKYALFTFHRTENVDNVHVARQVIDAINKISEILPVIFPLHPRTKDQFEKNRIELSEKIIVTEPLGMFDFVNIEKHATVVLTDSGTVPEECTILNVPCIVLRNSTERQELMENGSFIMAGFTTDSIIRAFNLTCYTKWDVQIPEDYRTDVSNNVLNILLGYTPKIVRRGHDEY